MKTIYCAANIIEAHIVSGMLNANGVDSYVTGHYLQGGVGEISPTNFANVLVADNDVAQAQPLIDAYEQQVEPFEEQQTMDGYQPI